MAVLCCVYLIAPVCSCFLWSPGEILLLQSVKLTAACWLLAQLQSIDGQPVGSPAQVAFLSFTFHIAFALRGIGRLDLVTTVAFCSELQTCKHVTSGGKRKEKGLASLVNEDREVGAIALLCVLIIHWAKQIIFQSNWMSRTETHRGCWSKDENTSKHYSGKTSLSLWLRWEK